ncbi:flagellar operon protein [Paenibacillus sp. SC116]|uniref:TIGR02530 family flagellar biosynthesis protein n=1 Tax=Paenibacillus sp. SC116 TaxID=2968986 RepID=UPI00215A763B|nr:TIGR02530 family flagellar biosynthesis protein [Paenibacillus sp. SC116]MCR8845453.1 flagellar operon protein [Paenibacillus sp. SC116]
MRMNIPIGVIGQSPSIHQTAKVPTKAASLQGNATFQQMLDREISRTGELRFSHHAEQRMKERGLKLTPELMDKLNKAIVEVEAKGSRQSLLLADNAAYIVNVPSRTVITALADPYKQGHVFTAIDSTVFI